jgi:addiction module HigA family antidote
LNEEFLKPLKLNADQLGEKLHVPATRIAQILKGKESIDADMALRLARFYGTTPQLWMNAQSHYDLEMAEDASAEQIFKSIEPYQVKAIEKNMVKITKK